MRYSNLPVATEVIENETIQTDPLAVSPRQFPSLPDGGGARLISGSANRFVSSFPMSALWSETTSYGI
jgi:hypothetical protein